MNVGVVILNYNGWQDTLACVESVLASAEAPACVVIVDNASSNDSILRFRHWAAGNMEFAFVDIDNGVGCATPDVPQGSVVLLRNAENGGYAAGNNAGMRLLMRLDPPLVVDAVWILNNDTVVDKNALGAMRDRLFAKRRPGLCGSLVRYMGGDSLVQCRGGGLTNQWTGLSVLNGNRENIATALLVDPDTVEQRINFIYGASVMASRAFIEQVGPLDEQYFLYCEEQDWFYGGKGKFDIAYAPDAVVYHKEGATTGFSRYKANLRSLWHLSRSRILLTAKHHPHTLPTVLASMGFAAVRMAWRRLFYAT